MHVEDWESDWEPEPGLDWEDFEPEPADLWTDQAISWLLPGRRQMSPDPDEPGRFSYANPAAEALANFMYGLDQYEFGEWFAMAMRGALFLRQWAANHQVPPPLLLLRAFLILLAVSVLAEPGRAGRCRDPVLLVPSAPLVRAHAILTAAPPYSRAPVPAGAPA